MMVTQRSEQRGHDTGQCEVAGARWLYGLPYEKEQILRIKLPLSVKRSLKGVLKSQGTKEEQKVEMNLLIKSHNQGTRREYFRADGEKKACSTLRVVTFYS